MNIGVIGLGTIAQKAYLPLYTTHFSKHIWHFSTRTEDVLKQMGDRYGVPHTQLFTDWKEMAEKVDAVFIHTPTQTHEELIQYFLVRQIPVFVDKPITDNIEKTKELLQLAEEKETELMTGFNRRFAPMVQEMKQIESKNVLHLQKNQSDRTDFAVRDRIYDMMIHPIDTALYLAGYEVKIKYTNVKVKGNQFLQARVVLESDEIDIVVSINNQSGAKREVFELQSPDKTVVVENLTDWKEYTGTKLTNKRAGDWVNTLDKRGFLPMIDSFLTAVEEGKESPVSISSSLVSHEICEAIISLYESERR